MVKMRKLGKRLEKIVGMELERQMGSYGETDRFLTETTSVPDKISSEKKIMNVDKEQYDHLDEYFKDKKEEDDFFESYVSVQLEKPDPYSKREGGSEEYEITKEPENKYTGESKSEVLDILERKVDDIIEKDDDTIVALVNGSPIDITVPYENRPYLDLQEIKEENRKTYEKDWNVFRSGFNNMIRKAGIDKEEFLKKFMKFDEDGHIEFDSKEIYRYHLESDELEDPQKTPDDLFK